MKNRLTAIFLLFFLAGCATQESKVADINMAMGGTMFGIQITPNIEKLKKYEGNPYLTSAVVVDPVYIGEYSSAMESAIFNRNLEAVEYLVSVNAPKLVSLRWADPLSGAWKRTPVNIPAAEMACAMGEMEIMKYLQKAHPEDKVNYTNCLNYYVSTGLTTDKKSLRHGHAGSVVNTIIELGADVNGQPEYGRSLHSGLLGLEVYTGLQEALLIHGLDVNAKYTCFEGECAHLTTVSAYKNTRHSTDLMYLLLAYGADINIKVRNRIEVDVLTTGELKYEDRIITPLHKAAYFSRPELYARLVDLGADETITDNLGKTPQQYAGIYSEFNKLSKEQKARYQKALAQRSQQSNSSNDLFGKAVALGFGALAIGSMDVPSGIAGEAFTALATDIMTDSGGSQLNKLNQDAMRDLEQSQKSFSKEVNNISSANTTIVDQGNNREPKKVDCVYEFIKTRQRILNRGVKILCDERAPGGMAKCAAYRDRTIIGETNRQLAASGLSQCQISVPPPARKAPNTPSGKATKEA